MDGPTDLLAATGGTARVLIGIQAGPGPEPIDDSYWIDGDGNIIIDEDGHPLLLY